MIYKLNQARKSNAIQNLKYQQKDLEALLDIQVPENSIFNYLLQTEKLIVNLKESNMLFFFKETISQDESYTFVYNHDADKKYMLYNFILQIFISPMKSCEILLIESQQTINIPELIEYLYQKTIAKIEKIEADKLIEKIKNFLKKIISITILSKLQQKILHLTLPSLLKKNRSIKIIIYCDMNNYDHDFRSKAIEKFERQLRNLSTLNIIFKKDYHLNYSKEPLVQIREYDELSKILCQRVTKILTQKIENSKSFIRYLVPIEQYKIDVEKKNNTFKTVLLYESKQNKDYIRAIVIQNNDAIVYDEILRKPMIERRES